MSRDEHYPSGDRPRGAVDHTMIVGMKIGLWVVGVAALTFAKLNDFWRDTHAHPVPSTKE